MSAVISVENLSKAYQLGQIGTGTLTNDLKVWWAKKRGKPNQLLRIGEVDHGNRDGETLWALKDVSFTVEQGEVLGIIGRNGAGKSTLLKVLSRITAPTSGKVKVKGRVASLLEVGTGFHPELTGRENIYLNGAILGMRRREIDRKFDEIVDFAEIEKFIETPVKRYSSGMYVRLAFAVAAHLEPEILLVDEVLAVGDAAFQKKCLGKMGEVAHEGRTVLFVSHNMASVRHLCRNGNLFDGGRMSFRGSSEEAVNEYELGNFHVGRDIANGRLQSHVLFEGSPGEGGASEGDSGDFRIDKIELLDIAERPMGVIRTWDEFKMRIHYSARRHVRTGSLAIQISTMLGEPIALLSTQPDSNVPMEIREGHHLADCNIHLLPLAAGEYFIGAGLAIPKKEWLCWNAQIAVLTVAGRDVFKAGMVPISSRALLALPHEWVIHP